MNAPFTPATFELMYSVCPATWALPRAASRRSTAASSSPEASSAARARRAAAQPLGVLLGHDPAVEDQTVSRQAANSSVRALWRRIVPRGPRAAHQLDGPLRIPAARWLASAGRTEPTAGASGISPTCGGSASRAGRTRDAGGGQIALMNTRSHLGLLPARSGPRVRVRGERGDPRRGHAGEREHRGHGHTSAAGPGARGGHGPRAADHARACRRRRSSFLLEPGAQPGEPALTLFRTSRSAHSSSAAIASYSRSCTTAPHRDRSCSSSVASARSTPARRRRRDRRRARGRGRSARSARGRAPPCRRFHAAAPQALAQLVAGDPEQPDRPRSPAPS